MSDEFDPDWASPPGHTIKDILEERRMAQKVLAIMIERSDSYVSLLLKGKKNITVEVAFKLEETLGSTAEFWMTREVQYRVRAERLRRRRKK